MAFCYATGNAGTWMCLQGAVEYGYEFAPVAGIINLFVRMPRPPYGFVEVSVADGQTGAAGQSNGTTAYKQAKHTLKNCWHFKAISKPTLFLQKFLNPFFSQSPNK